MRSCDNESIEKYNGHITPTNFSKELVLEFNLVPQVIINVCGSFKNIFFQHALESLVERTCAAQNGKEFLYKRVDRQTSH